MYNRFSLLLTEKRLVCQYVDDTVKMPDLEKEVASL